MAQRGFRFPWARRSEVVAGTNAAQNGTPTSGEAHPRARQEERATVTADLIFLGTAAALPAADRSNAMLAITEQGKPGVLIDCGAGVVQNLMRAGIAPNIISDILVTHAHIDHCGNLPSLLESWRISGRTAPLRVLATPETMPVIRELLDLFAFELTLDNWPFSVDLVTTEPGEIQLGPYAGSLVRMDHAVPSVGVRLDLPLGTLAYTCDTQPNPNIPVLAEGARTLISECTFLSAQTQMARLSRHLTAREVGQIAQSLGVPRLALVHLGVAEVPNFLAEVRQEVGENYTGELIIPNDCDVLKV